jgi:hypothetical protein
MIQSAMMYVIEKYSHIKTIEIQDETFINIPSKPLITARRLLTGRKGWYEDYFGATPKTPFLAEILRYLRLPSIQEKVKSLLPPEASQNQWWIPNHIKEIADSIREGLFSYLIGSMWVISKETINHYDIKNYNVQEGGGHFNKKKIQRIWSRAFQRSGYVSRWV